MSKTDKELTIDIVTSIIAANPRINYSSGQYNEKVAPSINGETIDNLIKHYYTLLSGLEKS
jgi:hypothetical protein